MAWSDAARAAALEVRRMRSRRLFHGTTSLVKQVTPQPGTGKGYGIFLTTDPKDARAFAKQTVGNRGGHPVVHMVRVKDQPELRVVGFRQTDDTKRTPRWFITTKPLVRAKILRIK